MKKTLLFFFLLFSLSYNNSLKATHLAGGDFNYICVGQDSFMIYFNLYRDCTGATAPNTAVITFESLCDTFNVTLQKDSITEVSQLCPTVLPTSACNGGTLPGMEQHWFSGLVVIPQCALSEWTMSWNICCRNSSNNIVGQPTFFIEATMNNNLAPCNNSPKFNAQPIPYVCKDQPLVYNFGVTEFDGDSLVFILDSALQTTNNGSSVPYQGTFNGTAPFDVPVFLNTQTGEVQFTPATNGFWVIKVCALEFRNGVQIGRICRDIQFVVQDCLNYQPYMMAPGITNFNGQGQQIDSNSLVVCYGDTFSFEVFFGDSLHPMQVGTGIGDSITLTSNVQQVLPGALVNINNGNPASIQITWTAQPGANPFSVFFITAIDDACTSPGFTTLAFDIIVNEATWAGPDQRICSGQDTAFVSASGGNQFVWSVLAGDPINLNVNFSDTTGTNGQNVWMSPTNTTTYIVSSNSIGSCQNSDTITIFISRDFNLIPFGDTTVCSNSGISSFPIGVVPDTLAGAPFNFSYKWNNSNQLNNDSISNPLASPNPGQSTTYRVTVTSDSGCIKTSEVVIDYGAYFPDTLYITFSDTVLCLGDSTTASVNFGINLSPNCQTSNLQCGNNNFEAASGTNTTTNGPTQFSSPYTNHLNRAARTQFLYRANELNSMGMTDGARIFSLAFFVQAPNNIFALENFTIRMACTSKPNLTNAQGWEDNGLQQVFFDSSYAVMSGWNTHALHSNFDWDGTSNLIIEICYNNSNLNVSSNASVRFTPTTFTSVRHLRQNSNAVCSSNNVTGTSLNRPNTLFGFCKDYNPLAYTYNWSPAASLSAPTNQTSFAFPITQTTYNVTVTDTNGLCSAVAVGTIDVVTAYNTALTLNTPLCPNGGLDTASVIVPGGTFAGSGINPNSGVFDPSGVTPGIIPVSYSLSSPTGGCFSSDTFLVEVLPIPNPNITSPIEFCQSSNDTFTLSAASAGGIWSGNIAIIDSVNGLFVPSLLPVVGNYNFIYTISSPCFASDTLSFLAHLPYDFTLVDTPFIVCYPDTAILGNYTTLTGPNFGTGPVVYTWQGAGITDSLLGHFSSQNTGIGTFLLNLSVSDTNGVCATNKDVRIIVLPVDTPTVLNELTFCSNDSNALVQVSLGFGTGANWSTTPISPTTDTLFISSFGTFDPRVSGAGTWVFSYQFRNASGCSSSITDTIRVLESPVNPILSSPNFCEGNLIIINAISANPDSLFWYLNRDSIPNNFVARGANYSPGNAIYPGIDSTFVVYAQSRNGRCVSNIASYVVPILPFPTAEFELQYGEENGTLNRVVVNALGVFENGQSIANRLLTGTVPLFAQTQALPIVSNNNDSLFWDFWQNGSSVEREFGWPILFPNTQSATHVYEFDGLYRIQLIRVNQFGCADTTFVDIDILSDGIPPNVFTPNGDGINDEFRLPGTRGLRDFNFRVYNRWGRLVFETDFPMLGWDGRSFSGEEASDGVYFWIATGKRGNGKDYNMKGNVTLLRQQQ